MKTLREFGDWALVTGATQGIGAEYAEQLAAQGFNLVIVARREAELRKRAGDWTARHGVQVRPVALDLSQEAFLAPLLRATQDVDVAVVIANAGGGDLGAFAAIPLEHHRNTLRLNLQSSVDLLHHYSRHFQERPRRGAIQLLGSTIGMHGAPFGATYSGVKAAIIAVGEAVNFELRQSGVHVSVLSPGPTDTPLMRQNPDADLLGTLPLPPMPVGAVVREGLEALRKNRAHQIAGGMNRFMGNVLGRRLLSRSASVGLWGSLLKGAVEKKGKRGPEAAMRAHRVPAASLAPNSSSTVA